MAKGTTIPEIRLAASKKAPYLSRALYALVPLPCKGLGTFGVSEEAHLFYDPEWLKRLTVEEGAGVIGHEVWHLLRDHAGRAETRGVVVDERGVWNIAVDLEINSSMTGEGWTLPSCGCFPAAFGFPEHEIGEKYYAMLKKSGKGRGIGKRGPVAGNCGSGAGNPLENEEMMTGGVEGHSAAQLERLRVQVARDVREAAKGTGNVSEMARLWAEEKLGPPKIDWRRALASAVRVALAYRAGSAEPRCNRISRRMNVLGAALGGLHRAPILPRLVHPVPEIALVVDTSGSMMGGDTLGICLREVRGVLRIVAGAVSIISADCSAGEARKVWSGSKLELFGGGGTDFRPGFLKLAEKRSKPSVVVYLTDGHGPAPAEKPRWCEVVWVLVGERTRVPAPWGRVVRIDD